MKSGTTKKSGGFSLVEMMVAMAVGLVIMGAATQLFKSGMTATMTVTDQAEMQQNVRSALNLISRDVSMAGSGLPPGGLALPYGAGATPSKYACNQVPTCYLKNYTYPTGVVGKATVSNYMFGLIPGPLNGMESGGPTTLTATGKAADSITSIYVDYSFPLNQYTATFANVSGTSIVFTPPAAPPVGFPGIISPTGINVGDLILLSNSKGSAVGEVTGLTPGAAGVVTMTFANADPLNINQSGAANANIKYLYVAPPVPQTVPPTPGVTAYRLYAVSYFVEVPANGQTPRLMRQVNGQKAVPMADNIIGMNLTYDTCDNSNTGTGVTITCAGISDPIGNTPSYSPNLIRKVNIQIMGQTVLTTTNTSRSMVLVTSVSTRNMSFKNRYQ